MTVWVKEVPNIMTIDMVRIWLKNGVKVKPLSKYCAMGYMDCIITTDQNDVKPGGETVLIFEDIIEKISNNILQEINNNFDYYYLLNALNKAKEECIDTIITGSSYGLFGIEREQLPNAVNLSLFSQDLYYSIKGINEVCAVNKNIRNIVLCCSYYYFHSDLSRAQNAEEMQRISKVYYPLFGDLHNCVFLPPRINMLAESNIFDFDRIIRMYTAAEYEKGYFNAERPRKNCATKEWDDKSKVWSSLSESEMAIAGRKRAETHNKGYKYENSVKENRLLFRQLSEFCMSRKINLVLVVTPVTKYYRESIYDGFKDIFLEILNEDEGVIHLLDLYEDPQFIDEDFNDMDHLSDSGAQKMTSAILELLQQIDS